ncbi:MAG TPA: hypothetical protein VM284_03070, partial [Candidatus Limnocylindria bacterium]|nr:hypothetical protein [Candidatus Limnocylindria bacterium]
MPGRRQWRRRVGSPPRSSPSPTPSDGSILTGSLIVYSDAALEYDFGPEHPLTPRRFPPSIDLIRTLGADNFVEPRVATDDEIARLHTREYIDTVRRFGADPFGQSPKAGIGPGDCPPFENMHEASARVVGGSLEGI